jgi:hypothetical protein
MSDFPHNYLETIMGLRVAEAGEVEFAKFISGAVHALQVDKAGKAYSAHPARVVLNVQTYPEYENLSDIRSRQLPQRLGYMMSSKILEPTASRR